MKSLTRWVLFVLGGFIVGVSVVLICARIVLREGQPDLDIIFGPGTLLGAILIRLSRTVGGRLDESDVQTP